MPRLLFRAFAFLKGLQRGLTTGLGSTVYLLSGSEYVVVLYP